jgi:hypothetical protein
MSWQNSLVLGGVLLFAELWPFRHCEISGLHSAFVQGVSPG